MTHTPTIERLDVTVRAVIDDGQTRTIKIHGGTVEVYVHRTHEYLGTAWRDVRCRSLSGHTALCEAMGVGAITRELVLAQHPSGTWPVAIDEPEPEPE